MQVRELDNGLEIMSSTELNGETIRRRMWFSNIFSGLFSRFRL